MNPIRISASSLEVTSTSSRPMSWAFQRSKALRTTSWWALSVVQGRHWLVPSASNTCSPSVSRSKK